MRARLQVEEQRSIQFITKAMEVKNSIKDCMLNNRSVDTIEEILNGQFIKLQLIRANNDRVEIWIEKPV